MAKNVGIAETVSEFIKPVVEEMGLILWDVQFVKEDWMKKILSSSHTHWKSALQESREN